MFGGYLLSVILVVAVLVIAVLLILLVLVILIVLLILHKKFLLLSHLRQDLVWPESVGNMRKNSRKNMKNGIDKGAIT